MKTEFSEELARPVTLRQIFFSSGSSIAIALLFCLIIPISLVSLSINQHPQFSPLDEFDHLDYVNSISHWNLLHQGQTISETTMRDLSCDGLDLPGFKVPPCSASKLIPSQFPGSGLSTEAAQPPLYYGITYFLSWVPLRILHLGHLKETRLTGAFWLSAGLFLFWFTGKLLKIPQAKIASGVLLLSTLPIVVGTHSLVTNDASSLFAGSLIGFLGALAWVKPSKWTPFVFAVAAFALPMLKATTILPITVLALLYLILLWNKYREPEQKIVETLRRAAIPWIKTGGVLLFFSGLSLLIWYAVQKHSSIISEANFCKITQPPAGAPFSKIFYDPTTIWQIFSLPSPTWTLTYIQTELQNVMLTITGYVGVASALSILFVQKKTWANWGGALSLVMMYLGGLSLGYLSWKQCGIPIGFEGRYGISLLPFLVIFLISVFRGRSSTVFLWILSITWLIFDMTVLLPK